MVSLVLISLLQNYSPQYDSYDVKAGGGGPVGVPFLRALFPFVDCILDIYVFPIEQIRLFIELLIANGIRFKAEFVLEISF